MLHEDVQLINGINPNSRQQTNRTRNGANWSSRQRHAPHGCGNGSQSHNGGAQLLAVIGGGPRDIGEPDQGGGSLVGTQVGHAPRLTMTGGDGSYTVTYPDLPGCTSEGKSLENALYMAQDALCVWLGYLLDEAAPLAMSSNEAIQGPDTVYLALSLSKKSAIWQTFCNKYSKIG